MHNLCMEIWDPHVLILCVSEDWFSALLGNDNLDMGITSSYLQTTIVTYINEFLSIWHVDNQNENYPSDNTPMPPSLLAQCGVVTRGQEYDNQLGRQLIMPPGAWCLITSPPSPTIISPAVTQTSVLPPTVSCGGSYNLDLQFIVDCWLCAKYLKTQNVWLRQSEVRNEISMLWGAIVGTRCQLGLVMTLSSLTSVQISSSAPPAPCLAISINEPHDINK